jgi:hypothetical protein
MSDRASTDADAFTTKPSAPTRIARKLGLTEARAYLVGREIARYLPEVSVDREMVKKLAVFPRLGIVYNRIQKNANTTTMLLLDALETGSVRSIPDSKGQHLLFYKAWLSGRFSLQGARYMVVVRSPLSRALSAFLFKFDYHSSDAQRRYGRSFETTPTGFRDYLIWLRDGALSRDLHWDLQLNSLALPIAAFTDLIHIERYEVEMRAFLWRTRLGPAAAQLPIDFEDLRRRGTPHATTAQVNRKDFFTPESRRLVSDLYAEDFRAFGYDPE